MSLTQRPLRLVLAGFLAAVAAALLFAPGFPAEADAATPCSRFGDTQPRKLTQKHARNAVICFINRARNNHGRGDLHRDDRLQTAARRHSERMAKGCFSHQCSGERSVLGRLQSVSYIHGGLSRWAYGENIAWGQRKLGTPRKAVKGWMHSSGHRANILSGTFKEIGAGFDRSGSRGYFTADFGLSQG